MSAIERPEATYSMTVQVQIDGMSAPLAITAGSINEIRKAVRLLQANKLLVPQCPAHQRPMRPSKNGHGWYCTAKVGEGYCDHKA